VSTQKRKAEKARIKKITCLLCGKNSVELFFLPELPPISRKKYIFTGRLSAFLFRMLTAKPRKFYQSFAEANAEPFQIPKRKGHQEAASWKAGPSLLLSHIIPAKVVRYFMAQNPCETVFCVFVLRSLIEELNGRKRT